MPTTLQITLDRPRATYYGGETVTGRVRVRLDKDKPTRARAVSIEFVGKASVRWTERRSTGAGKSRGTSTTTYSAKEVYFSQTVYLAGGDAGELSLSPGEHVYPFQCTLPRSVPSSFEGEHGYVRYTAKAAVHRPWKFDHSVRTAFTVVSPLDLNLYPTAKMPIEMEQSKTFCCLWCQSGPLTMFVRVPAGGYAPGQCIPLEIQIDNASTTDVESVRGALKQIVRFHARTKSRTTRTSVVSEMFNSPVKGRESKAFVQKIHVPSLPPSLLTGCGIIDVEYKLKVTAIVDGMHTWLDVTAPILIGTFPLVTPNPNPLPLPMGVMDLSKWDQGDGGGLSDDPPAYPGGPMPSAPPGLPSPDLPPPRYEECVFRGNTIMDQDDGDSAHTMGAQQSFTPRYPVWNLIGWNVDQNNRDQPHERY